MLKGLIFHLINANYYVFCRKHCSNFIERVQVAQQIVLLDYLSFWVFMYEFCYILDILKRFMVLILHKSIKTIHCALIFINKNNILTADIIGIFFSHEFASYIYIFLRGYFSYISNIKLLFNLY